MTDSAANIRATFHNEITEINNYFFIAHTFQLVITNSINGSNGVSNVLKKVQSIVPYYRRSWKAATNLASVQTGQRKKGFDDPKFWVCVFVKLDVWSIHHPPPT